MKLIVLGATGRTGLESVRQALEHGQTPVDPSSTVKRIRKSGCN
jgi:uncharacterized protein YbjT (DUF2867 family)